MNNLNTPDDIGDFDVAIIGMACRFPGAKNVAEFWRNLRDGMESISFFSDEELKDAGIDPALLSNPNYVKARGVLEGGDMFDASFFGYNPREAEMVDPQHRVFLECSCEALEHAGYDPRRYDGRIGVYAGSSMNTYVFNNLYPNLDQVLSGGGLQAAIGNDKDSLTTTVSYHLNLTGPSVTTQTASSTSLVAICLACQSLLDYQCDMALAGGVSANSPRKMGYLYQEGGIASADGHCRAYDAKAQGFVSGDGVGVVVLKRLADALADGDVVYAVIKGFAINNDGSVKVSYTAPSVQGQVEVITEAQAMADIEPETISYIEGHGTATALGDPIEIAALTQVFRAATQRKNFCAVGSVKTNIGHLDTAAGVAGLIKTTLALKHNMIPPSLHFEEPNPAIDFANSPFYVNTKLAEWKQNGTPRRAGVTSLGMGGTNAHVVLEEAPVVEPSGPSRPSQLLILSAKTGAALEQATANLAAHLKQHSEINLADAAYTLQVGRQAFDHRRMLVCQDLNEAIATLDTLDPQRVLSDIRPLQDRPVVFMFSGQGAQYVNMGLELYQTEPTFRQQVQHCAELLKPHLGLDLCQILYPNEDQVEVAQEQLTQTHITQPALFVIEYALARLWQEWGVHPQAMIGHSIGEYVAACLAGVFSLEDALSLVAARGQLMQSLPGGAMMVIPLPIEEATPLLGTQLSLAAHNGPSLCVVSGPTEAVEALENRLAEQGLACRRLHTSHAFHSEMMAPMLASFIEQVKQVKLNAPQIPYISNVSGNWITEAEATDPAYWARHIRQTVCFAEGVMKLLEDGERVMLEVGPGQTLSTLVKQQAGQAVGRVIVSSLRHPREQQPDVAFILKTLGRLWLAGVPVDWFGFYAHEQRRRASLPTYPFERQRYWLEPPQKTNHPGKLQVAANKKVDITDWFYTPSWKRLPSLAAWKAGNGEDTEEEPKSRWLVFVDESGLGSQLVQRLKEAGRQVISVAVGEAFEKVGEGEYTLNPHQQSDYAVLFEELSQLDQLPQQIIHLWNVTSGCQTSAEIQDFEAAQYLGFYSLLFLTQAFEKQSAAAPLEIWVVSNDLHEVTGSERLCPKKATLLGPCKIIPQEHPNITCRNIDLTLPESGDWPKQKVVDQILVEVAAKSSDLIIAHRGHYRWGQTFEPTPLDATTEAGIPIREAGVYLITGGVGSIGLVIGEHLARTAQAKLIFIERPTFPPRESWSEWLVPPNGADNISRKIQKVQELEALGAEVLVFGVNGACREEMETVVAQVYQRFGEIHGVVHADWEVDEALFRAIFQTGQAEGEQHFQTKVHTLLTLESILRDKKLDFYLLQSSLSTVLGGLGLVADAAANLFLDTFARKRNRINGVSWISLNWDLWQLETETGQASPLIAPLAELAITPKEGVEAWQRILSRVNGPQIVISTSNLQARLNQWIQRESPQHSRQNGTAPRHARPELQNVYVAPRNETEQMIADIWQELLGIEQVGIHDTFFDLGGHSLLAIQVIGRLRDTFHTELPMSILFDVPTVAGLAAVVTDTQTEQEDTEKMEILNMLALLSEEEVEAELDKRVRE